MKKKRLGEVLRDRGQVSAVDLNKAIQDQSGKLVHLGELMLERGVVSKKDLVSALAEVSQIPYMDCANVDVETRARMLIPREMAMRCSVLPINIQGKKIVVTMAEPQNLRVIDELRFKTGMEIIPMLGFRNEINAAIEKHYGPSEAPPIVVSVDTTSKDDGAIEFISSSTQQRNIEAMREVQAELQQKSKTTPAVQVVASIIRAAIGKGASDIHIEPQSAETVIRFRVDGMLRDHQTIPRGLQNSVASRIKILSDMDIAERRTPQDGRFLVKIAGRRIDLRVSTLPTQYGEKVVMRLLESDAPLHDLIALGFPPAIDKSLRRMLRLPQGMILVTGPTGSGKSTTLYSSLNIVRRPSINIITVEDPVEYAVAGLNQVQVNTKAGLTFASCLRSILRQDPNVIMVGEIRDKETAEIAVKAAQTGHLVLSTLHTNDSISAVTRLLDLDVPGFQLASSLTGIIAQRLIRRLCPCHKRSASTPEFITQLLELGVLDRPELQSIPNGCEDCDLTGYKGRIGIYELLSFDDAIRSAVRAGGRNDEIRLLARENGMKLMQEQALESVLEGITTLDEVQRVVPLEEASRATCTACHLEVSARSAFCPHCGQKRAAHRIRKPLEQALVQEEAISE
jgi:type IV pilus assembly protein PilB